MEFNDYNEWENFTKSREVVVPPYVEDTDSWYQNWVMVIKGNDGKFWECYWRNGATEYQELDFEYWGYCAVEVVPYEVTVTKYKSV